MSRLPTWAWSLIDACTEVAAYAGTREGMASAMRTLKGRFALIARATAEVRDLAERVRTSLSTMPSRYKAATFYADAEALANAVLAALAPNKGQEATAADLLVSVRAILVTHHVGSPLIGEIDAYLGVESP